MANHLSSIAGKSIIFGTINSGHSVFICPTPLQVVQTYGAPFSKKKLRI
jgi:hypothetical protein